MSSIARRAGSKLIELIERAGDPGGTANRIKVYGKDDAAVTQLFAQDSAGTVHQITPSAASSADFILARMSGNQTFAANTAIDFDTDDGSSGISVDGDGLFSGLASGKNYLLVGSCSLSVAVAAEVCAMTIRWHDVTAAADIGITGEGVSVNNLLNESSQPITAALLSPGEATEVECRFITSVGTTPATNLAVANTSYAFIQEV